MKLNEIEKDEMESDKKYKRERKTIFKERGKES